MVHPLQSPDLNPIQGVWNILKQQVQQHIWNCIDELKEVLQDEWAKIMMDEVHAHLKEMPE